MRNPLQPADPSGCRIPPAPSRPGVSRTSCGRPRRPRKTWNRKRAHGSSAILSRRWPPRTKGPEPGGPTGTRGRSEAGRTRPDPAGTPWDDCWAVTSANSTSAFRLPRRTARRVPGGRPGPDADPRVPRGGRRRGMARDGAVALHAAVEVVDARSVAGNAWRRAPPACVLSRIVACCPRGRHGRTGPTPTGTHCWPLRCPPGKPVEARKAASLRWHLFRTDSVPAEAPPNTPVAERVRADLP